MEALKKGLFGDCELATADYRAQCHAIFHHARCFAPATPNGFGDNLLPLYTMPNLDEWREMLGREDLSDEEIGEFVQTLRNFLGQFLDDYLRDKSEQDEV